MNKTDFTDRVLKEYTDAGRAAVFYGFSPIQPPEVKKLHVDQTKEFAFDDHTAEKAALLDMYFEERFIARPQPCMFLCERPFPGLRPDNARKKTKTYECSLVSLGSSKSVCECLSLEAGISLLNSLGYKNLEVEINSVGDKDSTSEFNKRLVAFIRKNIGNFPPDLRQAIKKDHLSILRQDKPEWEPVFNECPKHIDYLSEASRNFLKEVLEFLEILDIPYRINYRLVPDTEISSETVLSIVDGDSLHKERLALGTRFNKLSRKLGHKKELPSCILNIEAKLRKPSRKIKPRNSNPNFYLVQFGPEAKLKSFIILRELYKAGATVLHAIAKDKLGTQMGVAESSGIPYIILIGQKEALENSVVIRNTSTRAQEMIPITAISSRIKELTEDL
jgi:histidyl-tRNA synthetase